MANKLEHYVEEFDAQREGLFLTNGHAVYARVQTEARTFGPVLVAIATSKSDAEEIAELFNEKYNS